MTPTDFLILTLILSALLLVIAWRVGARPKAKSDPEPAEVTRWRRFQIDAVAVTAGEAGVTIAAEESGSFSLQLLFQSSDAAPLEAGASRKKHLVSLKRKRFSVRPLLVLQLEKRPWLSLKISRDGGFPQMLPAKKSKDCRAPEPGSIALQGDLAKREYEVRVAGRLTASVSWQRGEGSTDNPPGCYYVEIVKGASALPLLALTLALEVAASRQGAPVRVREKEAAD